MLIPIYTSPKLEKEHVRGQGRGCGECVRIHWHIGTLSMVRCVGTRLVHYEQSTRVLIVQGPAPKGQSSANGAGPCSAKSVMWMFVTLPFGAPVEPLRKG